MAFDREVEISSDGSRIIWLLEEFAFSHKEWIEGLELNAFTVEDRYGTVVRYDFNEEVITITPNGEEEYEDEYDDDTTD
jgi:hypothetical protein